MKKPSKEHAALQNKLTFVQYQIQQLIWQLEQQKAAWERILKHLTDK